MRKRIIALTAAAGLVLTGCTDTTEQAGGDLFVPTEEQARDLCNKAARAHDQARIDDDSNGMYKLWYDFTDPGVLDEERQNWEFDGRYGDAIGSFRAECAVNPGEDGRLPYAVVFVYDLNTAGSMRFGHEPLNDPPAFVR